MSCQYDTDFCFSYGSNLSHEAFRGDNLSLPDWILWLCKWCHSAICASDWMPMPAVAQGRGRRVSWLDLNHSLTNTLQRWVRATIMCSISMQSTHIMLWRQIKHRKGRKLKVQEKRQSKNAPPKKGKNKAKEWKRARVERVKKKQEIKNEKLSKRKQMSKQKVKEKECKKK